MIDCASPDSGGEGFWFPRPAAHTMLPAMIERVFLGWDGPFAGLAARWLLDRCGDLPRWQVIVPTAQAGRRLREALVEWSGGALMSPRITTPGAMLRTPDPVVAADWMEQVAWLEVLEGITDWEAHAELFPGGMEKQAGWAEGLAGEWTALRRALQENGMTLKSASRMLSGTVEADRWEGLAKLELLMEGRLRSWGLRSRSSVLAEGLVLPDGIAGLVLAGVAEVPPLLERVLRVWGGPVTALVAAPEEEAAGFSALGLPLGGWADHLMPWPEGDAGSVLLVADPRQEAAEALRLVAANRTPSNEVALCSPDPATGTELEQVFTQAGWVAFHPAARPVPRGLERWLKVWMEWLVDPRLSVAADLLALPETESLVGGERAVLAVSLARLRGDWMVMRPEDLRVRLETAEFRSAEQREGAWQVLRAVETLESRRKEFQQREFATAMTGLLKVLATGGEETSGEAVRVADWLVSAVPVMRRVKRDPVFWIRLMLEALPVPSPSPPEGRVIDILGWLELLFEPGRHLVLCGMNEGKVPARETGDPWLGETARRLLGLRGNADRAARDAFLYQAVASARRQGGRVDVLCAKSGPGGEALLPSRLLLASPREDLPERVRFLFQGVEPPDAGMRWHPDWRWQPRAVAVPRRLSVTAFPSWLACPFRFYLKHVVGMSASEAGRLEWNARDFGSVAHEILERWGRDVEARDLDDADALHRHFGRELDRVVDEWFGSTAPLAVCLQAEALRQRFKWLARVQAGLRADGWEVVDVERKFELALGDWIISGKIDRIDRHRESGVLRVIDYKTGNVDGVEREHRKKVTAATVLPAHIGADTPVVHAGGPDGASSFRWTNLQLPLYALALRDLDGVCAIPCYFAVGTTEGEVAFSEWQDFSEDLLLAARNCSEWILGRIGEGVFWPPSEKPRYDDFALLGAGRALEEMCGAPGG
jgi:ATP-dependent helicase/nuclease subunit B